MAASGLPIKSFFNTSGMKYRELGLKDMDQLTVKWRISLSDGMLDQAASTCQSTEKKFAGYRET